MMTMTSNSAAMYAKVGVETGVLAANPHKLILMLFDGALLAVTTASSQIDQNRVADKGQSITRAIDIITNGLRASLNMDTSGDLAQKLDALYDYMCLRLLHANLKNDKAALTEVAGLLGELKGAWEEIADDQAVLSANRAAA